MTSIDKLLSLGSEPLALRPQVMSEVLRMHALGPELFDMLQRKNGFYAFESALHVFPLAGDSRIGLEEWNSISLWRDAYEDLTEGLLFFAEDILQDQFCLSLKQEGVLLFYAETGQTAVMADSVEQWANLIVSNYKRETGWPFVEQWRSKNGPLSLGKRLQPKTPFFLGGEYNASNLWAGDPILGMRFKGDLAIQTRHLPEGASVELKIAPLPQSD